MLTNEKKEIYNRVMENISQMVIKRLQEGKLDEVSIFKVRDAYKKKREIHHYQDMDTDYQYEDYMPEFTYYIKKKAVPFFDHITVSPSLNTSRYRENTNITIYTDIVFYCDKQNTFEFEESGYGFMTIAYSNISEEENILPNNKERFYLQESSGIGRKEDEDDMDKFLDETHPLDLVRCLSVYDAKQFTKEVQRHLGFKWDYRNFVIYPQEFEYPNNSSSAWVRYLAEHGYLKR